MPDVSFERAYPIALRAAEVRVAGALAAGRLTAAEREEWIQELLLAAWRALPRFNATRASLRTYIERVVANRYCSLVRSRRPSLDEPIECHQHHLSTLDGIPSLERRLDFDGVLDSLPARDRSLAAVLVECTPTEASRSLGIARSTVYGGIRRIREALEGAGFGPCRSRSQ